MSRSSLIWPWKSGLRTKYRQRVFLLGLAARSASGPFLRGIAQALGTGSRLDPGRNVRVSLAARDEAEGRRQQTTRVWRRRAIAPIAYRGFGDLPSRQQLGHLWRTLCAGHL